MKKSVVVLVAILVIGNFLFSSCGTKMFAGRAYRQGNHATRHGTKAQARVNKANKHFWF